jgi:hypothetical protein
MRRQCSAILFFILALFSVQASAQHTGADLTKRYYDTSRDCGGPTKPAFLCSGVLLRGTQFSTAYHSWDPSPLSVQDGGISFSYLRTDAKLYTLAYGYTNGIIFYADFSAPPGKMDPDYLCAFPLDAATDNRTQNGCGIRNDGYAYSKPCQDWKITTGQAWVVGYTNGAFKGAGAYGCGFITGLHEQPLGGTAAGFGAVLDAIKLLGEGPGSANNEIRAATWAPGSGKTLPIEAFFYIGNGVQSARNDQQDLYNTDHVWVPVIKVTLPTTSSEEATFHYIAADQAIPPADSVSPAQALAQQTAAELVQRYNATSRDCGGPTKPAFLCSGILLRGTNFSTAYHSWDPSPTSVKNGGISFSYLRVDAKNSKLVDNHTSGIIFYPAFSAPSGKLDPDYLCAFPLIADTDNRTQNGCGMTNDNYAYSRPCQDWKITTGMAWNVGYTNGAFKNSGKYACGFIVGQHQQPLGGTAAGFDAVLDAIKLVSKDPLNQSNELRAATWAAGSGKTLPIEAFFYLGNDVQSAQNNQRDLFKTDQVWVPVIKMTLPKTMSEDATFQYVAADQAIPPQVADIMKHYYDTSRDCGGPTKPAFLCSGVLIRGTQFSTAYHSWDPSPLSVQDGGISFSYLRTDAKLARLAYGYNNGLIFYPDFGAPQGKMDPDYLCAFPMDADTNNRTQNGCGLRNSSYPDTKPCQEWNVTTGAAWVADYTNGAFQHSANYGCGFEVGEQQQPQGGTAAGFAAVLDAIKLLGADAFNRQNEIRAQTWAASLGKTLPIEAFFYVDNGVQNARNDQQDLYKTAQVWVPVIKITLPKTMSDEATFEYVAADQAVPPQD